MPRIETLTAWAKATGNSVKDALDQGWLSLREWRGTGRHRYENALYYGHSATSVVLRLRRERELARYTREAEAWYLQEINTAVLPVALPSGHDDTLRWDDTDTELLAIAR